ncbi:MAG: GNAT family N-acetyltransferase [Thermocrispum sp.]
MAAPVSIEKSTIDRAELGELAVRMFEPADVPLIEAMSADLSARSLAQRFFVGTPYIPRAMLRQLGQVDHVAQEAVIAQVGARVVGLAQYVRSRTATDRAEFAVMVADRWQFAGIGRRLVGLLAQLAVGRGITQFEANVLVENLPARRMVAAHWPAVVPAQDEDSLHYLLPLREVLAAAVA